MTKYHLLTKCDDKSLSSVIKGGEKKRLAPLEAFGALDPLEKEAWQIFLSRLSKPLSLLMQQMLSLFSANLFLSAPTPNKEWQVIL